MRIGPFVFGFREAVKPAPEPSPGFQERLEVVEEGLQHVVDEFESVLDRINRWSARQAAQKRAQAIKALDEVAEPTGPEIVDSGANGEEAVHPDELDPKVRRRMKAELMRRRLAKGA